MNKHDALDNLMLSIGVAVLAVILELPFAFWYMFAWNHSFADAFAWPRVNYWQAFLGGSLVSSLFGLAHMRVSADD